MPTRLHACALSANAFNYDATILVLCYRALMAANRAEQALVEQWRDILALHARTQCELDRVLHEHGLCASDFEVLDLMAEGAGGCAYRVQEISERVHL
ncbi:MarR family transcriptional regulator, partial [Streptomyces broussonetiae]